MALTASTIAVVAGITYNFLPFMTLPLYASIERIDPRLLEAGADLYGNAADRAPQGHPAADACPGIVAGHAAHVHPGGRRLRQRLAARRHPEPR